MIRVGGCGPACSVCYFVHACECVEHAAEGDTTCRETCWTSTKVTGGRQAVQSTS